MISVSGFREAFPEFADATKYPDSRVQWWLNLGMKLADPCRWGNLYEEGVYLFTAHNLTLEYQRTTGGGSGGGGSGSVGAMAGVSKKVGDVSISKTFSTTAYDAAGEYGATVYGQQYYDLVMLVGTGGTQL